MGEHCTHCGTLLKGRQQRFCGVPCHDKHYRWVMEQGKAKERQRQVRNRLAKGPKPETTVACLVGYARRLLK